MDQRIRLHLLSFAPQLEHELAVIHDAEDEHCDAEQDQRHSEIARRLCVLQDFRFVQLLEDRKIVKPKPIRANDVRMTDISVRSADIRVR